MAIPLYAAIAGTGQIRQLDVRGTPDDYDGSVGLTVSVTTNAVEVAGDGGWARIRRVAQSGIAGNASEALTVTLVRDGNEDASSITRSFGLNGPATIPVAGGATQLAVQLTLVGEQGSELGSAELWIVPRRTLRSGDGS